MVVLIGRFRNILLLHELIIIDIAQKWDFIPTANGYLIGKKLQSVAKVKIRG